MGNIDTITTAIVSVITAIGAILTGMWFIIRHAYKAGEIGKTLSEMNEALKRIPCQDHESSIKRHDRDIQELKSITKSNNAMLTELCKWVMKNDASMIDTLAKKFSPLKMTKAGEELYKASHAETALNSMKDLLMSEIEKAAPRTEYDTDEEALNALLHNVGHKEFDQIKRFIYYSPSEFTTTDGQKVRFDLYAIIRLMAITLRDMYLKAHPEII